MLSTENCLNVRLNAAKMPLALRPDGPFGPASGSGGARPSLTLPSPVFVVEARGFASAAAGASAGVSFDVSSALRRSFIAGSPSGRYVVDSGRGPARFHGPAATCELRPLPADARPDPALTTITAPSQFTCRAACPSACRPRPAP